MTANLTDLFVSANHDLQAFLSRADGLVHGISEVGTEDLRALGHLLDIMAPKIADASRDLSADAVLQEEVQRYVANLRSLQISLEQVRCVMLARRAKLDAARQHVEGVRNWASAYSQTAQF